MSIILIAFVVVLVTWFLTLLAVPRYPSAGWAAGWLAFLSVVLLAILVHVIHA